MFRGTILAVCLLGVAAFAAHAQTPSSGGVAIRVDGHAQAQSSPEGVRASGGKPAEATVTDVLSGRKTTVTLSSSGRGDATGLENGFYRVEVDSGDRRGTTYVMVEDGKIANAELSAGGLPTGATTVRTADALGTAAQNAADACDRAAYDKALQELDRVISMAEINLRDVNRIIEEYGRLSGYPADMKVLTSVRDTVLSGALGGRDQLRPVTRAGAPVNTGIRYVLRYIAALEEKARIEARLAALRAARQAVPAFPQKCSDSSAQQAGVQFTVTPEVSVVAANRPQFAQFRLEFGGAITKLGAFKPDDTDTGTKVGVSAGVRWDAPWLGVGQKIGIEAKLWYVDYKYEDSGEVIPEPGGTVGIFSPPTSGNPFGGYFTGSPLTNGWYDAKVENYGGEVKAQTWFQSGNLRVMPSIGLRLQRTDVKENLSFDIGMPAFTTFTQDNDYDDFAIGPMLGLRLRLDVGQGLYAFTEGSVAVEHHSAKGKLRTIVPAVETEYRKQSLSSSKWGVSAGVDAGLGWQIGRSFNVEFSAGISYTNASPFIEYKEADSTTTGTGGAEIGYGSQTDYNVKASMMFRF